MLTLVFLELFESFASKCSKMSVIGQWVYQGESLVLTKMLLRNPEGEEDSFYSVCPQLCLWADPPSLSSENDSSALVKLSDFISWLLLEFSWSRSRPGWKIFSLSFSCTGVTEQGGCSWADSPAFSLLIKKFGKAQLLLSTGELLEKEYMLLVVLFIWEEIKKHFDAE